MKTPEYFTDQYGHIYRWQSVESGEQSVNVANFQQYGSRAESNRLIDKANSADDLLAALEAMVATWEGPRALAALRFAKNVIDARAAIARARGEP